MDEMSVAFNVSSLNDLQCCIVPFVFFSLAIIIAFAISYVKRFFRQGVFRYSCFLVGATRRVALTKTRSIESGGGYSRSSDVSGYLIHVLPDGTAMNNLMSLHDAGRSHLISTVV